MLASVFSALSSEKPVLEKWKLPTLVAGILRVGWTSAIEDAVGVVIKPSQAVFTVEEIKQLLTPEVLLAVRECLGVHGLDEAVGFAPVHNVYGDILQRGPLKNAGKTVENPEKFDIRNLRLLERGEAVQISRSPAIPPPMRPPDSRAFLRKPEYFDLSERSEPKKPMQERPISQPISKSNGPSGRVLMSNFRTFLTSRFGSDPQRAFKVLDVSSCGKIYRNEFVFVLKNSLCYDRCTHSLNKLFALIDTDCRGWFSLADWRRAFPAKAFAVNL